MRNGFMVIKEINTCKKVSELIFGYNNGLEFGLNAKNNYRSFGVCVTGGLIRLFWSSSIMDVTIASD